jgi:hypothetical protein
VREVPMKLKLNNSANDDQEMEYHVVHIVMKESQMKNDTVSFVQKFLDRYHE